MAQGSFRQRLDELEDEKSLSYSRFKQHGKDFIEVVSDGIPETEALWVSADEIYEASDADKSSFEEGSEHRVFTSIYNLLCDAEVLDAFHDSEPYEINSSTYEEKPLIEAWKYVSGESFYEEDEEGLEIEDRPPEEVDDLYQELKD